MANELLSDCLKRGRNRIPECYRAIESWPSVDESLLKGQANRQRYRRLCAGIELYLQSRPLAEIEEATCLSSRRFLTIIDRCLEVAPDGRIWGLRACVYRARIQSPQRRKEITAHPEPRAGFQGAFRKFLVDHPEIETKLRNALVRRVTKGAKPNRLNFREAHKEFKRICRETGVAENVYPLSQTSKGAWGLRKWIRDELIPHDGERWVKYEHGDAAAQAYAFQLGDGTSKPLPAPYEAWELDEVTIDHDACYELPNASGDWEEVRLRRPFVIRVIDVATGAKLANRLVLASQVSAEDVSMLLWEAISGVVLSEEARNAGALEGAGFPAAEISELRFAVPRIVYLDNALAHLSNHVRHVVSHLWGAEAGFGRPGTPQERPHIEADFSAMARRLVHQLPGTTGSGHKDPVKGRAGPRVPVEALAAAIDCYCANANVLAAAASHYIAPLERLRRSLASGALSPTYLRADRRRPHYFNKPCKVTVKVDLRLGRRPYINYLYVRYSSKHLQRNIGLKGKTMWARPDFHDLRTIVLFDDSGREFGSVNALGKWGQFPHDVRIRKLFARLKREGELEPRPDDDPLRCLFNYLNSRADRNRNAALQLAYLLHYLKASDSAIALPDVTETEVLPIIDPEQKTTGSLHQPHPPWPVAQALPRPKEHEREAIGTNGVPRTIVRR
ncbi:hypothetical protein ACTJK4_17360 [Ralstonia sp. 22111]|uniref:hypothetical protein n=1 Tax=Ralstonia sp. 22111 TaxID=3453878 RepID=UPI003F8792A3